MGLGFVAALAGPVKPRGCFEGVDAFRVSGDLAGPKSWQAMIDSVGEKIDEEMRLMIEGELLGKFPDRVGHGEVVSIDRAIAGGLVDAVFEHVVARYP